MPLVYEPPADGQVRQAELLTSVLEYQPARPDAASDGIAFRQVKHPLIVVMSQDCDLEQDFNIRLPSDADPLPLDEAENHRNALTHMLLCDAYTESELTQRLPDSFGSKERRFLAQNQNERYHRLDQAKIDGTDTEVDPLFIDFRRHFGVPSSHIYQQFADDTAGRLARLPVYYLHDLVDRFYGYLARVAIA
jgi:hypothetical protein